MSTAYMLSQSSNQVVDTLTNFTPSNPPRFFFCIRDALFGQRLNINCINSQPPFDSSLRDNIWRCPCLIHKNDFVVQRQPRLITCWRMTAVTRTTMGTLAHKFTSTHLNNSFLCDKSPVTGLHSGCRGSKAIV